MLLLDVEVEGILEVMRFVESGDLIAGDPERLVRGLQAVEEARPWRDRFGPRDREGRGELVLRGVELVRVLGFLCDQRHRAVVGLDGHLVDHLARPVRLLVQGREGLDLIVDAGEHRDAEHPHGQEQQRDEQEPRQQLRVDGGAPPGHPVHEGAHDPWEGAQLVWRLVDAAVRRWGGGRHRSLLAGARTFAPSAHLVPWRTRTPGALTSADARRQQRSPDFRSPPRWPTAHGVPGPVACGFPRPPGGRHGRASTARGATEPH